LEIEPPRHQFIRAIGPYGSRLARVTGPFTVTCYTKGKHHKDDIPPVIFTSRFLIGFDEKHRVKSLLSTVYGFS
jgi:hypothetical protein